MATPVNPYVAGNPVGDSPAFIGRADVLREVVRVLRRSQDNAIVLYGQRRIGKTSVLQHLAAWLPREGPYRPVYFDLQDKADWPLDRVLQELARTIAHTLSHSDPDGSTEPSSRAQAEGLAKVLGPDPETAFRQEWLPAVLDDLADYIGRYENYEKWLPAVLDDLPEGSSLVLLFDEFDVLADSQKEQAAAAFFLYLRSLLASDPGRLQFTKNSQDVPHLAGRRNSQRGFRGGSSQYNHFAGNAPQLAVGWFTFVIGRDKMFLPDSELGLAKAHRYRGPPLIRAN